MLVTVLSREFRLLGTSLGWGRQETIKNPDDTISGYPLCAAKKKIHSMMRESRPFPPIEIQPLAVGGGAQAPACFQPEGQDSAVAGSLDDSFGITCSRECPECMTLGVVVSFVSGVSGVGHVSGTYFTLLCADSHLKIPFPGTLFLALAAAFVAGMGLCHLLSIASHSED